MIEFEAVMRQYNDWVEARDAAGDDDYDFDWSASDEEGCMILDRFARVVRELEREARRQLRADGLLAT